MENIYQELDIKPMINAAGTYTIAGGSKMSGETLAYMRSASSSYVFIRDFQKKIHEAIAEMTRNEAAYISNGAASGLYLAVAAAIQKRKGKNFNYLTKREIENSSVVMFKAHRNPYDLAVKNLGANYKEIGYPNTILLPTEADLEEAIDENTAAVLYALAGWMPPGGMELETAIKIAHKAGIPVIVDAAAQLPPVENLWQITGKGADVVVFSGGKDLRGPQSSGLMVGTKEMIDMVTALGFPNYGIGRMLKVGREEMAGLYAAVRQYLQIDHHARRSNCEALVDAAILRLNEFPIYKAERSFPNEAGQPIPRVLVKLPDGIQSDEVIQYLLQSEPSIFTNSDYPNSFYINPMMLEPGEMEIVLTQLEKFSKKYA